MKLAYFKLDATHQDYGSALDVLRFDFEKALPGNEFSVNVNKDKTKAWVKGCADSNVPDGPLLDTAPLEDAARVRAEVSAESWAGAASDFLGALGLQH